VMSSSRSRGSPSRRPASPRGGHTPSRSSCTRVRARRPPADRLGDARLPLRLRSRRWLTRAAWEPERRWRFRRGVARQPARRHLQDVPPAAVERAWVGSFGMVVIPTERDDRHDRRRQRPTPTIVASGSRWSLPKATNCLRVSTWIACARRDGASGRPARWPKREDYLNGGRHHTCAVVAASRVSGLATRGGRSAT
jgi:hypothetical protein